MPDPTITTLPPAPAPTDDRASFSAKSFTFFAALATFITEANAIVAWIAVQVASAASSAAAALGARTDALAAAAAAAAHSNASKWDVVTGYPDGHVVWSPVTYLSYRRKGAGSGGADPSTDTTGAVWVLQDRGAVGAPLYVNAATTAQRFATYRLGTAAFALSLPATADLGDWIGVVPPATSVTGQTVANNGHLLLGELAAMSIDVTQPFRLVYWGPAVGWLMGA